VAGGEVSEGGYIQGAGDDTENWAHGLTPPVFWANKQRLFGTAESGLPALIEELIAQSVPVSATAAPALGCVKPTVNLFVGTISDILCTETTPDTCIITLQGKVTEQGTWQTSPIRLDAGLGSTKLGSRNLRLGLPMLMAFVESILWCEKQDHTSKQGRIIIASETGKDLAIGVALATLCLFFDDQGKLLEGPEQRTTINKSFIRSRLGWISTSMPDVNPSRATLQSVNSFLMDRPR
jgi:tRNA A64-2'-O-ribosylphosphate transferase